MDLTKRTLGVGKATLSANKALYNKPYLTDDTDDRSFGAPGCVVLLQSSQRLARLGPLRAALHESKFRFEGTGHTILSRLVTSRSAEGRTAARRWGVDCSIEGRSVEGQGGMTASRLWMQRLAAGRDCAAVREEVVHSGNISINVIRLVVLGP